MAHARSRERYAARPEAAWALQHTTERQKHLAEILSVDQSTVSRYCSGEIESAVEACYDVIRKVTADPRGTAGPIIAGMMSVAQEVAENMPLDKVRACLNAAQDGETEAQHAEDFAQHRVLRAIARSSARTGVTPEDWRELADAIEAHDEAIRHENAAHAVVLYYARAYLRIAGRASLS